MLRLKRFIFFLPVLPLIFFGLLFFIFFSPNINKKGHFRFEILNDQNYKEVLEKLKTEKILKNNLTFIIASKLLRYGPNVFSGSYIIKPNLSNWLLIKKLRKGLQDPIKIIISSCRDKDELIALFSKKLSLDANILYQKLNDNEFLNKYGFNSENILVMFLPNTYEFYWNISINKLFDKFYNEYNSFWKDEYLQKLEEIKLSKIEVSILASIVEAETIIQAEAPIIAGLYYNRFKRKMHLQADPTLKFANKNYQARRILTKDKDIISAYNTYKNKGLTPGPICLPQKHYIEAVLNLVKHNYLYMVAKEDFSGEHYFSKNYSEHQKNAIKYRRALNKKAIYR